MPHWSERVFFLDFLMTTPWLSCFLLRATWTPLHLLGAPEKEGLPAFTCSTGWPYIRLWKWALQWKNPGVHGALSPATLCSTRGDSPVDSKSREILEISAVKLQWGLRWVLQNGGFFFPQRSTNVINLLNSVRFTQGGQKAAPATKVSNPAPQHHMDVKIKSCNDFLTWTNQYFLFPFSKTEILFGLDKRELATSKINHNFSSLGLSLAKL